MDLTNQYISESFHSLLQISGSSIVTDGTGSIVNFLDVSASSAVTASYISPAFINSVVATGAGLAVTTGTNIFTGSQIFSGSLFPAGPYSGSISTYSIGSPSASWKNVFAESIYLVSGSKSASISLSGSNFSIDGGIVIPTNQAFYGYLQGTASFAVNSNNAITASYALSSSVALNSVSASSSISSSFATTASYTLNAVSASQSTSASYAVTASYSLNALSASISDTSVTASYISPTFISASAAAAGFGQGGGGTGAGFPYSGSAVITGSLIVTEKITVSQSISASNINAGVPTSNAWQTNLAGSYFNNFTSNTDVSEILRFIAGLLSGSAPDASPNTRTYSTTLTRTQLNTGTSTIAGAVPISSSAADIIYLTSKGFAQTGSAIFNGISTVYTSSAYSNTYSSTAAGSTTVSSSVDSNLFGLGTLSSGNATTFYVSGAINYRFDDNSSQVSTATSQSQNLLSSNTFGTFNGLTIGKILTANPSVIPPAYQDGKFANVFTSSLFNNGRSFTSVSSSGYYHISASIRIASGSSAYSTPAVFNERIFWAPIGSITITAQTITVTNVATASLTVTSGSLSGAPYLRTATWTQNAQVNGIFNPLYQTNAAVASMSVAGTGITLTANSPGSTTCSIASNGTINTSNTVFDSTGVTVRSTSTVPFETDIIKLSGSLSFNAGSSGTTNITATSISPTTFTLSTVGINRSGATAVTNTQTFNYHTAGTFGQPISSGSMAYFGFPAATSLTATTESFTDEANRIQLNDNILSFSGSAFVSGSVLGVKDLQVKPGYLVDPSGSRRYWYPEGYGDTFKYYVRRFKRTASISSFTINIGQTLVPWNNTTTSGVSMGIIFKSSVSGSNNGVSTLTTTRLFDPSADAGIVQTNITANTSGSNPFGVAIDLYGSKTSGPSGNVYTVTLISPDFSIMNGSAFDEFYLIVRYKGEPTTPVTSLNVSAGT